MNDRLSNSLPGIAGEYFVAGELSRRGYIATVTLRNTQGIDILVSNLGASSSLGVQVKTNQGSAREWLLRESAEKLQDERLFYVFVNLNNGGAPSFHVVSSMIVAPKIFTEHRAWLASAGRGGKPHQDSSMRKFRDHEGRYLDAWDQIAEALRTPWRLA